jgi:hypothetical protein
MDCKKSRVILRFGSSSGSQRFVERFAALSVRDISQSMFAMAIQLIIPEAMLCTAPL